MNGRSSRIPAWARPAPSAEIKDGKVDAVDRHRSRIMRATASPSCSASRSRRSQANWIPGPGAYGRNDGGDAALEAAVLAQAVGRPVRLQCMRYEGHGWDPKGPASIHRARAGLDAQGNVVAYHYESKGFSRIDIDTNESDPRYSLAGQLLGLRTRVARWVRHARRVLRLPQQASGLGDDRAAARPRLAAAHRASSRSGRAADPFRRAKSFIDEVAHAAGADPVAFRLKYLKNPRDIAVVKAAAEKAGWQGRVAGPHGQASDGVAAGRGFAYCQRGKSIVAVVADVEVDLKSGKVAAKHFVVAHDCGLIVNPDALRSCIEGNVIHGASRCAARGDDVRSAEGDQHRLADLSDPRHHRSARNRSRSF